MKKRTVYLAGPINGCTDDQCKIWREAVKSKLNGEFELLDPMRRDYRGKEDESVNEIVEGDKVDIDNSDCLLINYPQPSAGTCMEMLYAWERGKYIVVVVPSTTKVSPWVTYHSHAITNSFEMALIHIRSKYE